MSEDDDEPGAMSLALFIIHPTLMPDEIGLRLGLDGHFTHEVGTRRRNGIDRIHGRIHPDTRWRHRRKCSLGGGTTVGPLIADFVEELARRRDILLDLRGSGGKCCLVVSLSGRGYFGFDIPIETQARMTDIGLDLGLEYFAESQNS